MRVIGTGWRYWGSSQRALGDMYEFMDTLLDLITMTTDPTLHLIIGGGLDEDPFPEGADRALYLWAQEVDVQTSVHVADWVQYGKAAGPIRNAQMITAGADLVVGFLHPESKGTRDCLDKAKRAKIPRMVVTWRPDKDPAEAPEPVNLEVVHGGLHLPLNQSETHPLKEAA